MQRYYPAVDIDGTGYMEEASEPEDGDYVKHSDALSLEERVKELEAALQLVQRGLRDGYIKASLIIPFDPDAEEVTPQTLDEIIDTALGVCSHCNGTRKMLQPHGGHATEIDCPWCLDRALEGPHEP